MFSGLFVLMLAFFGSVYSTPIEGEVKSHKIVKRQWGGWGGFGGGGFGGGGFPAYAYGNTITTKNQNNQVALSF